MIIKLKENPHISGPTYRLPTEDGHDSIYVLEGSWYEAPAVDADGNAYTVLWKILPDWDNEDESSACDWHKPVAIVQEAPWRDVTKIAELVF